MGKVTNISSKEQLLANANTLKTNVESLQTKFSSLKSTLSSVPNYDEFNLKGAASVLCSSIDSISQNMSNISLNISNYVQDLIEFDVYDLLIDEEVNGNPSDKGSTFGGNPSIYTDKDIEQENEGNNPTTNSNPTGGTPANNGPVKNRPTGGTPTNNNPVSDKPTDETPTSNDSPSDNSNVGSSNESENNVSGSENINNVPVNNSSNNVPTNNSDVGSTLENTTSSDNVDNTVNDGYVIGGDIVTDDGYGMDSDFLDDMDFDDSNVSTPSTDVDTSISNPSDSTTVIDNTSNKDSIVPEILTGLGIAAGAGAAVYGGTKVVKKMKENQEFDDEE